MGMDAEQTQPQIYADRTADSRDGETEGARFSLPSHFRAAVQLDLGAGIQVNRLMDEVRLSPAHKLLHLGVSGGNRRGQVTLGRRLDAPFHRQDVVDGIHHRGRRGVH